MRGCCAAKIYSRLQHRFDAIDDSVLCRKCWSLYWFRILRDYGVSWNFTEQNDTDSKERWKLYVLMFNVGNLFWRSFENVWMRDCSVFSMNSQFKLRVKSGLLHHCTWQLIPCIMLIHLLNHSKARDHDGQVRWGFRHLKFWLVVIRRNLKTDSEFSEQTGTLGQLVWSLRSRTWNCVCGGGDFLRNSENPIQCSSTSKVAVESYTAFDNFSALNSKCTRSQTLWEQLNFV